MHAAKKTGEVAQEAAHGTTHAAKAVGHGVVSKAREGYQAAKRAVHKAMQSA
ncbi:hypothetical protein QU481_05885 [Crenobacter sp. SG2303]|uniref:Senescence domain-containing protein n=1 Tax=Crenobacter oryzisoli TaxID=3056844 RepID=A0ABT7XLG3_9NEIS|nr:hypothetical protein [Crenobacter sp. SG2303]MDN0074424.1 hypothetical protein [Crenobacter sp. SG2303]